MQIKIVLFVLALLLLPSIVSAQEIEPTNPEAVLQSTNNQANNSTSLSFASNPYGCIGRTDRPHNSTHVPGTVNVVAETNCTFAVATISVLTVLQREVCSPSCYWMSVGNIGSQSINFSTLARTNSAASCVTGRYRGLSTHTVVGTSSDTYSTQTAHEAYVTCTFPAR